MPVPIEFLRPIPSVGLIPLAALLFGPRIGSELMIIVYACFWIVLIQVLYGIADIDTRALTRVRPSSCNSIACRRLPAPQAINSFPLCASSVPRCNAACEPAAAGCATHIWSLLPRNDV